MEETNSTRVCVTGGSGYIGSWLVKKLLEKGYTVHATLRNLGEKSKVDLLSSLPNADKRLILFQADINNPTEFQPAIRGCRYVFHVATPLHHDQKSQYKDVVEAAIECVRSIVDSCIKSKTVKRLVYTASVTSSSPLKEDGTSYKSYFDESYWTSLTLCDSVSQDFLKGYVKSKTLSEKEVLSYNNEIENGKLEVVSLPCGLVGGDSLLPYLPRTVAAILSLVTGDSGSYTILRFVQQLCGTLPLVHVDDVCEAHVFCMEKESLKGRFLCAAQDMTIQDMAFYFQENYPQLKISQEDLGGGDGGSSSNSKKLVELGFNYKYGIKKILDDSVDLGKRLGALSHQ